MGTVPQWYRTRPCGPMAGERHDCVTGLQPLRLDAADRRRLHRDARAERWGVDPAQFAATLERCLVRGGSAPGSPREAARAARALHLEDLALACGCIAGHEGAWDHFVRELRPVLYRAADALDPGGGAREIADSLYADLFGLREREGERQSLLAYYHGRSTLATWLRSVLAQRLVDRARGARRLEPLPEGDGMQSRPTEPPDPERRRDLARLRAALAAAVAALGPGDRLRLYSYYRQGLTLAQIGRRSGEHEATISRHLTRTRRAIRDHVIAALRADGLADEAIAGCVAAASADAGPLDLEDLLSPADGRKAALPERST